MDFKQDPDSGDIVFTGGVLQTVTGADETIQRVKQYLRTFLGEWFLDKTVGVDWFGQILVKNPVHAETILKVAIASVPGVNKLLAFSMSYDENRRAVVTFSFLTDAGVAAAGSTTLGA